MKKVFFIALFILLIACVFFLTRKTRTMGAMEQLSVSIDKMDPKDWCAGRSVPQREFVLQVLDRYRPQLMDLWANRKDEEVVDPKEVIKIGEYPLRAKLKLNFTTEFDRSVWSWEEAYSRLQESQRKPDPKAWISADTMANYLLRKEKERRIDKVIFFEPKLTKHFFRPNRAVRRLSKNIIEVVLNPGIFQGSETVAKRFIEQEWSSPHLSVRVRWSTIDANAYQFFPQERSARSFVNHDQKAIYIAPYSPIKTLAHEVGHVLGFDDHYYDVWHGENCYYTQDFRVADLMSDSENGRVSDFHWNLLDQVYPWPAKAPMQYEPFRYLYKNL